MTNRNTTDYVKASRPTLIVGAWIAMLFVALSPILWREFLSIIPSWWDWVVPGGLLALVALTFIWNTLRPLRGYILILLVLVIGGEAMARIQSSALWAGWTGSSWAVELLGHQMLRLGLTLVVMAALVVMGLSRPDYFLIRGQLDAPAEPVSLLRMKEPQPWTQLGRNFAIIISLVTLIVLAMGSSPSVSGLGKLLPMIPVVLVLATLNAFSEEFQYRAALLSQLCVTIGKQQALWITTAVFGLAHYYGSTPSGVAGVLMAGFLGWFLGKSMLETKGFLWAWFIHFLQDVIIFSFVAMSA